MGGDVAWLSAHFPHFIGAQLFQQDGGIRAHRLAHIQDRRQHFVVHLDQCQGFLGDMDGARRDGCHGVSEEQDFIARQRLPALIEHVGRCFTDILNLAFHFWKVVRGDHGFDPGQGLSLAGIDRKDAGMGVRAAQHGAIQHARQAQVGAVQCPPGDLFGAILADRAGADHLESAGRFFPGLL